jgi:3-deoxy-D-manno-octulosonic-acid transferase
MGAAPDRVEATGNIKFDTPPGTDSPLVQSLRAVLSRPVIVCGSTVEGEEPLVLAAFREVLSRWPEAVLILAPRHPERFDAVAALLAGLPSWRRSQWNGEPLRGGVFLLDSIGELASLYQLADIAFVGGSLVPRGGHNILEAARYGVPVVVGPHNENFRDIINLFLRSNAVHVTGSSTLASDLSHLLDDDSARRSLGIRARETWRANAGATARTLSQLERLLPRRQNVIVMPRKGSAG